MPTVIDPLKLEKKRYRNLLEQAQKYAQDIYHIQNTRTEMFYYPKDSMKTSAWNLADLVERTRAAQQLGYRVVLTVTDKGLVAEYEKQMKTTLEYFY